MSFRFRSILTLTLLCLVAAGSVGHAADGPEGGTLSLIFENDLFYGEDRNYTNGVRAAWLSPPSKPFDLAIRAADLVPMFPADGKVRTTYAIGQNMYTPPDITLSDPPAGSRPYAGWLYASLGVIAETGNQLDQLEFTLGIIGPGSLAQQTQKFIHRYSDSDQPRGWSTQIGSEPGLVATYQKTLRRFIYEESFGGFGFDVAPHIGGALGNVYTYANSGVTFRFGSPLPLDYGPPRIQPSLPGSGFFEPAQGFGWYLFAGAEGRAVARNIFLDGNTFGSSRSVEKKNLVADIQYGVALTWNTTRVSFAAVRRSREFEGQPRGDQFGTLSVSMQF